MRRLVRGLAVLGTLGLLTACAGADAIEIATVGFSISEKERLKAVYLDLAPRTLGRAPDVELRVEGIDKIVMMAIEFPFDAVMRTPATRQAYPSIMADTLQVALEAELAHAAAHTGGAP